MPVLAAHRGLGVLEVSAGVLGEARHRLAGQGFGLLQAPAFQQRLRPAHVPRRLIGEGPTHRRPVRAGARPVLAAHRDLCPVDIGAGMVGEARHRLAGQRLGLLQAPGLQQGLRPTHEARRVVGEGPTHRRPALARRVPVLAAHRGLGVLEVSAGVLGETRHRLSGHRFGLLRTSGLQQRLRSAHVPRRLVG